MSRNQEGMDGAVEIELAQEADLSAIRALAEEYRAEAALRGWDEPIRLRALAEVRAEALGRRFTLVVRGTEGAGARRAVQGMVIARPAAEGGVVRLLVVAGGCRRRGLGTALMRAALACLPAGPVYLELARENDGAVALYRGLGFELHREDASSRVLVRRPAAEGSTPMPAVATAK